MDIDRKTLGWALLACAVLFLILLVNAKIAPHTPDTTSPLTRMDLAIERFMIENDARTPFWLHVTRFGGVTYLTVIVLAALVYLRERWQRFLLVASGVLALALQYGFKLIVASARPAAARTTSYAFPSGHTLGATAVFGMLFILIYLEGGWRKQPLLRALLFVLPALIVLVGLSRITISVHWTTDVIGGFLLGVCAISALLLTRQEDARPVRAGRSRRKAAR